MAWRALFPAPRAPQLVLIWGAGAKENGEGQPGVSAEQPQHAGLGTDEGGELVHVDHAISFEDFIKGQTKP